MAKKEIAEKAEEMINWQCEESGCIREEVLWVSTCCFIEQYIHDEITANDLIALSNYLENPLDMDEVEKLKAKRKKQAEYRKRSKERRKGKKI